MNKLITIILATILALIIIFMAETPNNENNKVQDLEDRVSALENALSSVSLNVGKVSYPLDKPSTDAISFASDFFLKDKVFDLIWKKLFHYYWFLTTLDDVDITKVGAGGTATQSAANGDLTITTDVASGDNLILKKVLAWQGLFTFSQRSAFRTQLALSSNANQTMYIVIGSLSSNFYGFKIVNDTIYGVSSNNGTGSEVTVALATIAAGGGNPLNVEARYLPSNRITFYIIDTSSGSMNSQAEKGVITTGLPSPALVARSTIWTIKVQTTTTAAKVLQVSFLEYLQSRNILR